MRIRPDVRTGIGLAASAVYLWRVQDPKGSYAVFYDVTDWVTTLVSNLFVSDGAVVAFVRNAINLVLLDQVEGVLIGIALASLFSALLWPFKAGGRAVARAVRKLRQPKLPTPSPDFKPPGEDEEPPLELVNRLPADSSRPGSSAQS